MPSASGEVLPRGVLVNYGLPGLVTAIPTIPVFTLVPSYYAEDLGLGLAVTGAILLAGRVVDLVTDPLVGRLTDRVGEAGLKRLIAIGALIGAPALVMLLAPPVGAGPGWLLFATLALYLGWTLVQIPCLSWGAQLSAVYHQRTRVTVFREGASLIGILLSGALPVVLALMGLDEAARLAALGWLAVAVGVPAFVLLLRRVPTPRVRRPAASGWRGITDNRLFLRILFAWLANGLANGLPAVLFPLYCAHVLGANDATRDLLLALYFISAVAGIPLWLALSRRLSKHHAWSVAMMLTCPPFAVAAFLGAGDVWAFALICLVTGLCLGADLALPPAIQADVADWDRLRYRRNRTAGLFSLWSMAGKLALALAAGVSLPLLDVLGLDGPTPSAVSLTALAVLYALIPCALKLAAVAAVVRLPLTPHRQSLVALRLRRRDLPLESSP